jgi:hypothetical protein
MKLREAYEQLASTSLLSGGQSFSLSAAHNNHFYILLFAFSAEL